MPTFEQYAQSQNTKLLLLGHSGAGKTGSMVALAAAGYNVRIADLDKGVEILKDFALNPTSIYRQPKPGLWDAELASTTPKRLSFVPISDTTVLNDKGVPVSKGDSWTKLAALLNEWKDGDQNYGHISSWTHKDVLVIDGLSRVADAAFNHQLAMNSRLGKRPEQSDFLFAQQALKNLLAMLYSDEIRCNIVMICHIIGVEIQGEPVRGFPQTVGRAFSPQVGQYFNHALLAKSSGQGAAVKRTISTQTSGFVQLKTSAPLRVKPEYDLATGMAEYFADIRR